MTSADHYTVTVAISRSEVDSCVESALRSAYFAYRWADLGREPTTDLVRIRDRNGETTCQDWTVLDADRIEQGLRLMPAKAPRHLANLIRGKGDATTGDVIIQLAVFGEIKYV